MAVKTPMTPSRALSLIAAGGQVVVRDEEWLVRAVQHTPADGLMVRCVGTSGIVRDTEATFFTHLDDVQPLRPEDTEFVADDTPGFRKARLYLESMIRKTPIPATEHGLAGWIQNDMQYDLVVFRVKMMRVLFPLIGMLMKFDIATIECIIDGNLRVGKIRPAVVVENSGRKYPYRFPVGCVKLRELKLLMFPELT